MIALFLRVHLATLRRSPLAFLLPCLGIAVGVGAIVAIDLGSRSTVSSFRFTVERIEGRTTHQLVATTGSLDGRLAYQVVDLQGVDAAAPVLEALVLPARSREEDPEQSGRGEPLRLLGIDPFAEAGIRQLGALESGATDPSRFRDFLGDPGAILVSTPYLKRNGLAEGDSLWLIAGTRWHPAHVLAALPERVGDLSVPDNLAVCDLSTAQEITGRRDVDRIDLVIEEEGEGAGAIEAVGRSLPGGVELIEPGGRAARMGQMMAALNTNLRALSYLALFVSLFLIYNAMLLAVLRRRSAVGISRCLGATRGEVLGAWLLEAGLLGILGTGFGLLLGLAGGRLALSGIEGTASGLYGYVRADTLALVPSTFAKGAVVGLVAALAAALWPAGEAARTTPAHTSARGDVEQRAQRTRAWAPALAGVLVLAALVSLVLGPDGSFGGYAAAVLLALAAALLTPAAADAILRGLHPIIRKGLGMLPALAVRNIRSSMSRTGVALAALGVALAMSLAMGTMVTSFRQEMVDWIGETVAADIYISPATARVERLASLIDPELVEIIRSLPGVDAVDSYRGVEVSVAGQPTICAGIELSAFRRRSAPKVLEGPPAEELLQRMVAGEAAITESLSRKSGLGAGDRIEVVRNGRPTSFVVAGVYRDYSSDRGVVLLDRRAWEASFGPRAPNGVALYLAEGQDVQARVDQLKRELGARFAVIVRSNRSLRDEALTVFDRTFAVSRALEIIGVAVASLGILGALLAMLLERRRELATLRTLGLSRGQLGALLLIESTVLALLAWVFAVGLGTALAWLLLRVINVRSFGWSLPFSLPLEAWLANLVLALAAAGLATVVPIWRSRQLSVAAALREE